MLFSPKFGYRRYWNKNNGPFADGSLLIYGQESSDESSEVGVGAGIGYVYQLSDSFFLNFEGGYNTVNDDYYLGGNIDLSWSNLFAKIEFSDIDINIEGPTTVERPKRRDDQEHRYDWDDKAEEDTPENEDSTEDKSEIKEGRDYFVYQGWGNEYIELSEEYKQGVLALHGNLGTRNFSVLGYDNEENPTEDFVENDDVYQGRELMYFKPQATTTYLEISLPGKWQLVVLPKIPEIDELVEPAAEISGSGSDLIAIKGDVKSLDVKANQAEKYFEVIIWSNNLKQRSLIETNEFYQDSINLPQARVYLLEVIASDDWKIRVN